MIGGNRVCVVMPACNAGKTLRNTAVEIDRTLVDDIIVVDDASKDETLSVARDLGLHVVVHPSNRGYGGKAPAARAGLIGRPRQLRSLGGCPLRNPSNP
jgi:hypothetical protein